MQMETAVATLESFGASEFDSGQLEVSKIRCRQPDEHVLQEIPFLRFSSYICIQDSMSSRVNTNHSLPNLRLNIRLPQKTVCKCRLLRGSHLANPSIAQSPGNQNCNHIYQHQQSNILRGSLLARLKTYLSKFPENCMDAQIQTSQSFSLDPSLVAEERRLLADVQLHKLKSEDIFYYATKNKYMSAAFQHMVESASKEELENLIDTLDRQCLLGLVQHKYGNYIVLKMVERNYRLLILLTSLCTEEFYALAFNEFASRVMQALVELNPEFRTFVFTQTRANLRSFLTSIASVLLLSAAVKYSASENEYFDLLRTVQANPRQWVSTKYHKRVLTSILQVCSFRSVKAICTGLGIPQVLGQYLQEKYCAFIILTLLQKGYIPLVKAFQRSLDREPKFLSGCRYFRPLLEKLVESGNKSVTQIFYESMKLSIVPRLGVSLNLTSDPSWYFYVSYLLAIVSSNEDMALLSYVWEQVSNKLQRVESSF
jgi:hypothetical protein